MSIFFIKQITQKGKRIYICELLIITTIEKGELLIVDVRRFKDAIDSRFWKHITKESSFKDILDYKDTRKDKFVSEVAKNLNSFEHHFSKPFYNYIPKAHGILRKIKSYTLADTCIYYYCVKQLEDLLSNEIKKTNHVFGGFRFTKDLKVSKKYLDELAFDPEYGSVLAENNFREEWSDYQNLAQSLYERHYDLYIHIDVAHFYDDINLDILENKLRDVAINKSKIIDLLFNFLRLSDKTDLGYIPSSVGVPQEDVGEMSRLLANFYLSSFDQRIDEHINKNFTDGDCFYTRYADDMWFCLNGDINEAHKLIQKVSFELNKLKLHINESKLKFFHSDEFNEYWMFYDWIEMFENKSNINYLYDKYWILHNNKEGRWFSLALYILRAIISNNEYPKEDIINNLLTTFDEAYNFLHSIITEPKFTFRINNETSLFFKCLINKYPNLKSCLKDFLYSDQNIYPNVEYFILEFLVGTCNEKDTDFFYDYYFKATTLNHHWYSRCLCLKFLINYSFVLENTIYTKELQKLIKHFGNSSYRFNRIERRYAMYLIYGLRFRKGDEVLNKFFNLPEDKAFLEYIRTMSGV